LGRDNEIFLYEKRFDFLEEKNSIVLPHGIAAVKTLYSSSFEQKLFN
jgi:hypothetical protein